LAIFTYADRKIEKYFIISPMVLDLRLWALGFKHILVLGFGL
jgi:hypothetical protein